MRLLFSVQPSSCFSWFLASSWLSGGTPPSQGLQFLLLRSQTVLAMITSLEMVVGLVQICREILFFRCGQICTHCARAEFDARDELVGIAYDAIGAGENGAAVAADLALVAAAAIVLGEQFFAIAGVAAGERCCMSGAGRGKE